MLEDLHGELNFPLLAYFYSSSYEKDRQRLIEYKRMSLEKFKMQRQRLRARRKGFLDKEKELAGGDFYKSGSFS